MTTARIWMSRIFTAIITVALAFTAILKLTHGPQMMEGITRAGIPQNAVTPIAILELTCLAIYLIPRTRVLGAVLLTGYFGGAIMVHIITGHSVFPVFMLGVWTWGGIYFRVPSLPLVLPFRRDLQPGAGAEHASASGVLAGGRA